MAKWSQVCSVEDFHSRTLRAETGASEFRVSMLGSRLTWLKAWDAFWSDSRVSKSRHESGKIAGCPCHVGSVIQATFQRALTQNL